MKRVLTMLLAVTLGLTSVMLTGCGSSKEISSEDMQNDISVYQEELEAMMNKSENEVQMSDSLLDYCMEKGFSVKKAKGSNIVITSKATENNGKAPKDTFLVEFRKDTAEGSCAAMATGLAAVKNSTQHGDITLVLSPYSTDESIGV